MTLAKALGNGVPIGACLANDKAGEIMQPGNHGSTFGGNPLMCATASTVIDTIKKDDLISNARKLGKYIVNGFKEKLSDIRGVREVRGLGLMIGIELDSECTELVKLALDKQLLINVTAGNVIRLLPPLILNKQQADTIINTVSDLIIDSLKEKIAA
jgi:acetylornithine aminotransferase